MDGAVNRPPTISARSLSRTAIFCGVFVAARIGHSLSYLGGKQPWRTISFTVGGVATLVMVGFLVRTLIAAV